MKKSALIFFSSLLFIGFIGSMGTGCSFHNEEDYYAALMCDTANVTYSSKVGPIFQQSCTSCHSVAGGEISLDGYDAVKSYIDAAGAGQIPGSIRHITGFEPMPQGTAQLPECDIRKIEIWISAGYPNN